MATVTHTIYSHYESDDRAALEILTGQAGQDTLDDVDKEWQAESSLAAQRRMRAPPSFVSASQAYDHWSLGARRSSGAQQDKPGSGDSVAAWYRSVRQEQGGAGARQKDLNLTYSEESLRKSDEHSTGASPPAESRPPHNSVSSACRRQPMPRERRTKSNWFIMNAIASEKSSTPSHPPPTLADILQREPPPLAHEPQFRPPAWVALGPSNKGFTMLQRSGWNEGEPLGPNVNRQRRTIENIIRANGDFMASAARKSRTSQPCPTDVIDLTLSDSESDSDIREVKEEESVSLKDEPSDNASLSTHSPVGDEPESHRTALLTPIATVLKADRLGIGLKARTTGPHRASKKRITHNQAALAAHMRAAEEMRRRKRELGRGRRGFDRADKREIVSRQHMLAYLNS